MKRPEYKDDAQDKFEMGYNEAIDEFNRFLPDEGELYDIIISTKAEYGNYPRSYARALYKRIKGE